MSKATVNRHSTNKARRALRVRSKIALSKPVHRLTVHKSNKYIFAQIVDQAGKAISGLRGKTAETVGSGIADLGIKKGVSEIVFDRGQYRYHGVVKKLAEAAREAGLKF
ncbi:MAG: 50S ribosomal protein L18 [Patescibacteria group bacterium]